MLLTSTVKILPVAQDDIPTLSRILYEVNLSQPISHFIWQNFPNQEMQLKRNEKDIQELLDEVSTTPEGEGKEAWKVEVDGEVVGGVVFGWFLRKGEEESKEAERQGTEKQEGDVPEGVNPEFRKALISMFAGVTKPFREKDHLSVPPFYFFVQRSLSWKLLTI
jgi:hypothetical protein